MPELGLFSDPALTFDIGNRRWNARLEENYQISVMRWRDFLEKAHRSKEARKQLGTEMLVKLQLAETDPMEKARVLSQLTLDQVIRVLNPPTRLVARLMDTGRSRQEVDDLIEKIKQITRGSDEGGSEDNGGSAQNWQVHFDTLVGVVPPGAQTLSTELVAELRKLIKSAGSMLDPNGSGDMVITSSGARRVGFCLEGLLALGRRVLSGC